ncbi:MAG: DUF2802 domain-containing protein [Desulfosarcina sp.]|nr:DUF2802 domain-containing protein [Desulfobacterales bacterium]
MELAFNSLNWPLLMDILALGASAVLIIFLILNWIRYGRLVTAPQTGNANFSSEIALQMMTQQSRRSYSKLQQTLNHEFKNLQRLTGCDPSEWQTHGKRITTESKWPDAGTARQPRPRYYDEAARMIRKGADRQAIVRRCSLSRSEIDLMVYMQQKER